MAIKNKTSMWIAIASAFSITAIIVIPVTISIVAANTELKFEYYAGFNSEGKDLKANNENNADVQRVAMGNEINHTHFVEGYEGGEIINSIKAQIRKFLNKETDAEVLELLPSDTYVDDNGDTQFYIKLIVNVRSYQDNYYYEITFNDESYEFEGRDSGDGNILEIALENAIKEEIPKE